MHRSAPVHPDVLGQLPSLLQRELDAPDVAALVDRLLAAGWRPGQLGSRVGAAPSQGSPQADAAQVRGLLEQLLTGPCPDLARAQELAAEREQRQWRERTAPRPAGDDVRRAHLSALRAQLKGVPAPRAAPQPRLRPACSLCPAEGAYFVTRQVRLCERCVEVLASGSARLADDGGVRSAASSRATG